MNRIQQLNDMNEICYEKVLEQVKKGQQVLMCQSLSSRHNVCFCVCCVCLSASFVSQVMVFVHARNETVRTATVLSEMAKNNGEGKFFDPEQGPRYGEALKQVRLHVSLIQHRFDH